MIKRLIKEMLIENVIDDINLINIDDVEIQLYEIIDEIKYEFENYVADPIDEYLYIDDDEIVDLFDVADELNQYLYNTLYYYDKYIDDIVLNYEFKHEIIYLINDYSDYLIFKNNNDDYHELFDDDLKVNQFNHINSNDEFIIYNYNIDKLNTLNFNDIMIYFNIDEIVDNILKFENV